MDKIIPIKFKFNKIEKINNEILQFFDDVEKEIPEDNFKDTRNLIRKEISESNINIFFNYFCYFFIVLLFSDWK